MTSTFLHIIAMAFMLCDHAWATLFPNLEILTCIGRIAFPIFAFLTVEGYFHTGNIRKYLIRLLIMAFLAEIPFNLMYNGTLVYPFHQNVIWTHLIGLIGIMACERIKNIKKPIKRLFFTAVTVIASIILGTVCFVDFYGHGIMMIYVFYFFRGRKWWCYLGQFILMYWINMELVAGLGRDVVIFGMSFFIARQGYALLGLIPIWLYNGKKGKGGKIFQWSCYLFYPVHMLLLYLIGYFQLIPSP